MASDIKSTDAFEAALKRELQRAPSEPAADCPAPDVLAAYYDRTLSRNERARVDSHLITCARCQSIMAAIARADDSPAAASSPAEARVPFWITRLVAPIAVVGVVIAIAIGMRMRAQHAPEVIALASPAAEMKRQLAEAAPAPAPQPLPEAVAPSASEPANAPGAAIAHRHHHKVGARGKAAAISPKSEEHAQEEIAKPETPSALSEYSTGAPPASPSSASAPAAAIEAPSVPPNEAPVIGAAAASIGAASGAAPQAPERMAPSTSAMESAQVAVSAPATARSSSLAGPNATRSELFKPGAIYFSTMPDREQVTWHVGEKGLIMRHTGFGPWISQSSGVSTDLLDGAAPSHTVAWVVGKSGTLLRTTDGGEHWQLLKPPSTQDLIAVTANDAEHATVSAEPGVRFTTRDGGVTWSSP